MHFSPIYLLVFFCVCVEESIWCRKWRSVWVSEKFELSGVPVLEILLRFPGCVHWIGLLKEAAVTQANSIWGRCRRRGLWRHERLTSRTLRAHVRWFSDCVAVFSVAGFDWEAFALMEAKKCLKSPETLDDVVKGLHVLFEDDHVNVEEVISFLSAYRSNPADWAKYANYDPHRLEWPYDVVYLWF